MTRTTDTDPRFFFEHALIVRAAKPWHYVREPVVRRLPGGRWVGLHYSGGPAEPHADNLALLTTSENGGHTWSEPVVFAKSRQRAVWPTEVFVAGGEARVFLHTFDARTLYYEIKAHYASSVDGGQTWAWPVSVPGCPANFSVRQGIVDAAGNWIFPVYWLEIRSGWDWSAIGEGDADAFTRRWQEQRLTRRCGVIRSADSGATFSLHGHLIDGRYALWEPTVAELHPGHLVMLMRADGSGVLFRADSRDGGLTWSDPRATDIPNPGTKAHLLAMDGRLVLLHNPDPGRGMAARRRVELWGSDDDGETWPVRQPLATAAPGGIVCYPNGEPDPEAEALLVAVDTKISHHLLRVPYRDFLTR